MKRLFKFKYPKIMFLIFCIILSYFLFKNPVVYSTLRHLDKLSYIGVFIGGMLFAFGFSAPFAVGFFIALHPQNIWLAGLIGGIGAVTSDLLIFNFIKISFEDEFKKLQKSKTAKSLSHFIGKNFGGKIRRYLMYVFAGILIASPLPDEAGVIMLAGLTKIKQFWLAVLGFSLNTIGIMLLLYI